MNYEKKYLKYKNKYLSLKNLIEQKGGKIGEIIDISDLRPWTKGIGHSLHWSKEITTETQEMRPSYTPSKEGKSSKIVATQKVSTSKYIYVTENGTVYITGLKLSFWPIVGAVRK